MLLAGLIEVPGSEISGMEGLHLQVVQATVHLGREGPATPQQLGEGWLAGGDPAGTGRHRCKKPVNFGKIIILENFNYDHYAKLDIP